MKRSAAAIALSHKHSKKLHQGFLLCCLCTGVSNFFPSQNNHIGVLHRMPLLVFIVEVSFFITEKHAKNLKRPRRSHLHPEIDVLVGAEVLGDGDAVEVLARLAVVDGGHVEQQQQANQHEQRGGQADPHQHHLAPALVGRVAAAAGIAAAAQGDEGQQRVGEQEAEDEAKQVGVVVHPRQQPGQEEHGCHAHQLEDGHLRVAEGGPLVDHLHHAHGQKAEVGAGGADLE